MTLFDALQEFIDDKEMSGLSPASIRAYKNFSHVFLLYIDGNLSVENLSYDDVKQCIRRIMKKPLAQATRSTYVRNIKIFMRWIDDTYSLSFDPKKIKIPKRPRRAVRLLSDADIQKVFSSITARPPWIMARNKAMVALMLDSGVRQSEVCGLLKQNIDNQKMIMKITGKGAKDRFVPVGKFALSLINEYLSVCPYKDSEYVFLGRSGGSISTNAVKIFMNELKHQTGLDLSSHKLRHNYATNFCLDNLHENGCTNMADLSALLGHESIETTKIYEHFASSIFAAQSSHSHLDKFMF